MTFAAERPPRRAAGGAQPNGNLFPPGFVPPSNVSGGRGRIPQEGPTTDQLIQGLIQEGVKELQKGQQQPNVVRPNNNGFRPNPNLPRYDYIPNQPNPRPQYIPQPQPQYIPQQPPTVINTRPNIVPNSPPPLQNNTVPEPEPEPEGEPLVDNSPAIEPSGLSLLSDEDYTAMREALDESVAASVEELDELATDLGVAEDEKVKDAKAVIDEHIANGEPVPDEAIEAYKDAVKEAVKDNGGTITDDDNEKLIKGLEKLQTESEIAVLFDTDFPTDPFDPILPSGDLNLAVIPGLPPGQILYLPDGCLVTGTDPGGEMAFIQTTTAELLNVPVGSGDVAQGNLWSIRSGVLVMNPAENGAAVNFQFDGQNYSVAAGDWEHLQPKNRREIQFDPGNGGASIRYSLADGTYVFSGEGGGWGLSNRKFKLVINGEGHTAPFHYQANGEPAEIAPGATQEHSWDYPIVITFHRGKDGETAQRSFYEPEVTATIALDPADNMWDLFESGQVQAPPPPAAAKGVFDRSALKSRKKGGAEDGPSDKEFEAKREATRKSAFNLDKFRKELKPR